MKAQTIKRSWGATLIAAGLLGLLTLGSHSIFTAQDDAAYDPERIFTIREMREDFQILRNAFEEGHAGLYRYSSKKAMDKCFENTLSRIDRPMTEWEYLRLLTPLAAAVNCGHTGINASVELERHFKRQPVFPPFNLRFMSGKAWLIRNYSDRELLPGAEVTRINGHEISEILETLLPAIPSDGHIESSKFQRLNGTIFLGSLYNLFYGPTPEYALECVDEKAGAAALFKLHGLPAAEIEKRARERYPDPDPDRPPISFENRDGIPVITIRTFNAGAYIRAKIDYPAFLTRTFRQLVESRARVLIIDLRDNGGGSDDYGRFLFSHLIDEPFRYYKALETKKLSYDFLRFTSIPENRRTQPADQFRKNKRGWYDILSHPNVGTMKPIPPYYDGRIYVLINGRSFSASGEATSPMRYHRKAVFVGEECGAGYYGNNSGFMPTMTLPHTKIRVRIPCVRYTMAVDDYPADRGIIPEYRMDPTVEDLLSGRDTVLEYALRLARLFLGSDLRK